MQSICVYCGSSPGKGSVFIEAAQELGRTLAQEKIRLVYGGARVGVMGAVADAVLSAGGQVTGVIPRFITRIGEVAHDGLTELVETHSMHERKQKMFELSDGFIALPGGFGTLEELLEILTWQQLQLHQRPIGVLNVNGFYDSLDALFASMEEQRLLKSQNRVMALFETGVPALLKRMREYRPQPVKKWMDLPQT